MPHRRIIHLDLDAFFCAVEEQNDPSLVGKPFVVGGQPGHRSVVSSCSYAARRYGIHSAMPVDHAIRLCKKLRIITPRHKQYSQISRKVIEFLRNFTSQIEQTSIDEAFLDVSDMAQPAETIARYLQKIIREEFGLPCSLGVSTNKLVAKIANDIGKSTVKGDLPPNAITIVPPGEEEAFLAPLPVQTLWGIGPKTAQRLHKLGITSIGDLAQLQEDDLTRILGKAGKELGLRVKGIDERPIVTHFEPKSISHETTFVKDIQDKEKIHQTIIDLSESVAKRLRKSGYLGSTVKLKIRWPDFTTLSRQVTLRVSTDRGNEINSAALFLLSKVWEEGKAVRLIGVGISGFTKQVRQLSLWDTDNTQVEERDKRLNTALQLIRKQHGINAIISGKDIDKNQAD